RAPRGREHRASRAGRGPRRAGHSATDGEDRVTPSPNGPWLGRARRGDRAALARAISQVENEASEAVEILETAFAESGKAMRVGITGPPGAGKSTLCAKLALALRRRGMKVGIVAVDPTSPFSGGALLGDRVRMTELSGDDGVFIRSMASRGS